MKPMFLESRMFFAQPQTVISVPSAGVLLNSERISVRSIVVLLYKQKRTAFALKVQGEQAVL